MNRDPCPAHLGGDETSTVAVTGNRGLGCSPYAVFQGVSGAGDAMNFGNCVLHLTSRVRLPQAFNAEVHQVRGSPGVIKMKPYSETCH
jgi:hypothetical protein